MTKGLFGLFQPSAPRPSRLVSHSSFSLHSFFGSSVSCLLTPVFHRFMQSCLRILRFRIPDSRFSIPDSLHPSRFSYRLAHASPLTRSLLAAVLLTAQGSLQPVTAAVNYDTAWTYVYDGPKFGDGTPLMTCFMTLNT